MAADISAAGAEPYRLVPELRSIRVNCLSLIERCRLATFDAARGLHGFVHRDGGVGTGPVSSIRPARARS